ncbi:MAG: efflux RND transporter periplasmic adaptor subunit [bacterium]|nr:efflux RND transporter periplasmic adaptor subunit [bacterium]
MDRKLTSVVVILTLLAAGPALAQEAPATPVRFTAAREHQVHRTIRLPGTVEAGRTAVVASEVAGVVDALLAREGTAVGKGAPLVRLRREPIELRRRAAQGQLAEAEARLKSAELRLSRVRELHDSKVVSPQQVDDAAYDAEALEGRVAQLRAEVARLDRDLANATVRASFSGVVGREHTQVGEWLGVGDPVMELISLDSLEVRVEVPERHFQGLAPGAPARVGFESLAGFEVAGTVRAIVPRADPRSRTFPVLVALPDRDRPLGVGMLARVDLGVGEPVRATLVPKDAVVTEGRLSIVFVLNGDSAVRRVPVETGAGVDQWIAVEGEIAPGERVITRGNEALADGQQVDGQARDYPPPGDAGDPGS